MGYAMGVMIGWSFCTYGADAIGGIYVILTASIALLALLAIAERD